MGGLSLQPEFQEADVRERLHLGFRCVGIADAGFRKHEAVCLPDYLNKRIGWTLFHIPKRFSSMLPQNHDTDNRETLVSQDMGVDNISLPI